MNFKKIFILLLVFLVIVFVGYAFLKPAKTEQTSSNSVPSPFSNSVSKVDNQVIDSENETTNTIQNSQDEPDTSNLTLAEKKLSEMTLDQKIGQLFIVRPDSLNAKTTIGSNTRKSFKSISCRRNCFI